MFSTSLKICLCLWSFAWFVVILPGHTRGIVQLGGTDAITAVAATTASMQSAACVACRLPSADDPDNDAPSPAPRGRCALCQHLGTLETPPPVVQLNMVSQVLWLAQLRSTACGSRIAERVYIGRAPPTLI